MVLFAFFVPCLLCQVAYAHDWPTFLGSFSRADIPEHLVLSGNLVGSSLIVVEKPMEPTKEQKFVAGVTGAALVSLKFVQTSARKEFRSLTSQLCMSSGLSLSLLPSWRLIPRSAGISWTFSILQLASGSCYPETSLTAKSAGTSR